MINQKTKMLMGVCGVAVILLIAKLSSAETGYQNVDIQPLSQQEVTYPAVQTAAVSQHNTTYTTTEEATVVEESSSN